MAVVCFDASALVKLVVMEPGSDDADELWNGADAVFASRLAYPEVCAALAAAHRNQVLSSEQLDRAQHSWDTYWREMRAIELTRESEQLAGALARTHALGGADAVHLASALTLAGAGVILASWDRRLSVAARQAGLVVAPASLDA